MFSLCFALQIEAPSSGEVGLQADNAKLERPFATSGADPIYSVLECAVCEAQRVKHFATFIFYYNINISLSCIMTFSGIYTIQSILSLSM